jgi:hypothetical protein
VGRLERTAQCSFEALLSFFIRELSLGLLIRPKMKIYSKVGKCIYCGAETYTPSSRDALHQEHIIPEGLGGDLLLPEASCKKCEGATSAFEGTCLRRLFGPLRIYMGLPSKRPKDRPTTLPVIAHFDEHPQIRSIEVPIRDHPRMITLQQMDVPTLLGSPSEEYYRVLHVTILPANGPTLGTYEENKAKMDAMCKAIADKHGACGIQIQNHTVIEEHQLMLGKIAHSFAVAELGLDMFYPFLPDMIRQKSTSSIRMFVGLLETDEEKNESELHRLSLRVQQRGRLFLLICNVALFRNLGLTQYQVVVGRFYEKPPQIAITRQVLN